MNVAVGGLLLNPGFLDVAGCRCLVGTAATGSGSGCLAKLGSPNPTPGRLPPANSESNWAPDGGRLGSKLGGLLDWNLFPKLAPDPSSTGSAGCCLGGTPLVSEGGTAGTAAKLLTGSRDPCSTVSRP